MGQGLLLYSERRKWGEKPYGLMATGVESGQLNDVENQRKNLGMIVNYVKVSCSGKYCTGFVYFLIVLIN